MPRAATARSTRSCCARPTSTASATGPASARAARRAPRRWCSATPRSAAAERDRRRRAAGSARLARRAVHGGCFSSVTVLLEASLDHLLRDIDAGLEFVEDPSLAPLVHWRGDADLPLHRWMRYREGDSPGLIDALGLGDRILDPFCGVGSIMVGCAQSGRTSVGIDVNPLPCFAARGKLSPLDAGEIADAAAFREGLEGALDTVQPDPVPELRIATKLFEPENLDEDLRVRAVIGRRTDSPRVHDFLRLALVAVLQDVGSYFQEGNGIKYRNRKRLRDGYVRRPEGQWQLARFGADQRAHVRERYTAQLERMVADTPVWETMQCGGQEVVEGDVVALIDRVEPASFASILFSPPYANRFDYFEAMKVELWFGGFVNSYDELRALRKRSLRSHLGADLSRPLTQLEPLDELIGLMSRDATSWRMKVPLALRGYFADMRDVLAGWRRALCDGGTCPVGVGNSAYAGVIVPTDALLARIGLDVGFSSARITQVRHLTVAPQQRSELRGLEDYMRESVVSLT